MNDGFSPEAIDPGAEQPFANFSGVALADAMGDLDTQIRLLQERQKAARAEMTRRRVNGLDGARFSVAKSVTRTFTTDAAAIRAKMGETWLKGFQKPGWRTNFTVTPKAPEQLGVPA